MKNKILSALALLATGLAVLALAACSKGTDEKIADKTKEVYQDTKAAVKEAAHDTSAAMAKGWANLKSFTFEKRGDFAAEVKAKQTAFEAEVSKLRADYSDAKASASRKAAMNDLKDSETNYKEKLAAMGTATAATWDSARDNIAAAWDRMEASYAKARAGD